MNKLYTKQKHSINLRKVVRLFGLGVSVIGLLGTLYVFFPVLSWQLYLQPAFASNDITSPIPQTKIVNASTWESLLEQTMHLGQNFDDAKNWFSKNAMQSNVTPSLAQYSISIPKLKITDATVSTVDDDLGSHLVNFQGTALPPDKGNAVIFGHSTLPQLYNPKDYHTIFAYAHTLKVGDDILVNADHVQYKYVINAITIVNPDDTSVLAQSYDNSYLTIITCTPPGTTWKRLIIKSTLQKI
jgi:sortase A